MPKITDHAQIALRVEKNGVRPRFFLHLGFLGTQGAQRTDRAVWRGLSRLFNIDGALSSALDLSARLDGFGKHHRGLACQRGLVFETLRHSQIRAKAVLQDEVIDVAVEKVFKVRADFMIALEMAVGYAAEEMDLEREDREHLRTYRTKIYGCFNEKDELHVELTGALATLENVLGPVIRLEGVTPKDRRMRESPSGGPQH